MAHAAEAVYSQDAPQAPTLADNVPGGSQGLTTTDENPEPQVEPSSSQESSSQETSSQIEASSQPETSASLIQYESGYIGAADGNGDGSTELSLLYDYGNANTGLLVFDPNGSGYSAPGLKWSSGAGNWDWSRSRLVVTDYNGDGHTEFTVLYDYGNFNAGLLVFDPSGSGYSAPRLVWSSGPGNWDWSRSLIAASDLNGDNHSEVSVLYDYGSGNTGLLVFDPTGSGFSAPHLVWSSGWGNWDWWRSKMVASDYNGDGHTELAVLYNYGNNNTGLLVFDPSGGGYSAPRLVWSSGPGNWDWGGSKIAITDGNGDGNTELAVLYDYGNANTGLLIFNPSGSGYSAPGLKWSSGAGNWDWSRSKLVASDYNGDDSLELAVFYDYGNANTGLLLFSPSGSSYSAPGLKWASGGGNWIWLKSKTPRGEHFYTRYTALGIEWIDINLSSQVLSALGRAVYEVEERYYFYTTQTIFSTLISTGGPGMETPTGLYHVYSKNMYIDMSGPGYYAPNVPFVLWFTGPYSIHGTYWHNDFGWPHTHGCVNLPTPAAEWLWHRAPVGMPVSVHY